MMDKVANAITRQSTTLPFPIPQTLQAPLPLAIRLEDPLSTIRLLFSNRSPIPKSPLPSPDPRRPSAPLFRLRSKTPLPSPPRPFEEDVKRSILSTPSPNPRHSSPPYPPPPPLPPSPSLPLLSFFEATFGNLTKFDSSYARLSSATTRSRVETVLRPPATMVLPIEGSATGAAESSVLRNSLSVWERGGGREGRDMLELVEVGGMVVGVMRGGR